MSAISTSVDNRKFANLAWPRTVWAIGAVHGDVDRLRAAHDFLAQKARPGDRVVYLGNLIGRDGQGRATLDEIITFRRNLLAVPGMLVGDIVYLRGIQEEMWQKLLQLQFAPNPAEVLQWMLDNGVADTLAGYGGSSREGLVAAREGPVQLTRWTSRLRESIRQAAGHNALFASLKRAAYTEPRHPGDGAGALFVSAGIDPGRPLQHQGDTFWWGFGGFARVEPGYQEFGRFVRGYAGGDGTVEDTDAHLTLDGGSGRGGGVAMAQLDANGAALDLFRI
ncbi:MAG: hypothetical protein RLO50_20235 [Azospirillaceae bacterium]